MAEKLTENELNASIARLVEPECLVFDDNGFPMLHNKLIDDYRDLNYCRDWDLIMPLALKLNIGFDPCPTDNKPPTAFCNPLALAVSDDNPRRAIAECVYIALDALRMNKERQGKALVFV